MNGPYGSTPNVLSDKLYDLGERASVAIHAHHLAPDLVKAQSTFDSVSESLVIFVLCTMEMNTSSEI